MTNPLRFGLGGAGDLLRVYAGLDEEWKLDRFAFTFEGMLSRSVELKEGWHGPSMLLYGPIARQTYTKVFRHHSDTLTKPRFPFERDDLLSFR